MKELHTIFDDPSVSQKLKDKLPYLFQLAEIDNSRDGKLGMEIGSARERILIAFLIYKFGDKDIDSDIPITFPETDVMVFNKPLSIKTFSNTTIKGVKLIWTTDQSKIKEFVDTYKPECDMLLVHINWSITGGVYLITKECQNEILQKCGNQNYFKIPKEGTNSRGVEISDEAIRDCVAHTSTKYIAIDWVRDENVLYNQYERWIELWKE